VGTSRRRFGRRTGTRNAGVWDSGRRGSGGATSTPEEPEHPLAALLWHSQSIRGKGASMCFNPGDGQGMMEAYIVEKMVQALNERLVAAGLDRLVPNQSNAVHTVGEKIDSWRRTGSMFLGGSREPPTARQKD